MIRFLFKGLLRDKQRSLLPIIVVIIGVFLTVLMHTWIKGVFGDVVDFNAKFATGHVKIMTRGYSDKLEQLPNDLALTGVDDLLAELAVISPDIQWSSRIRFGGLVDVPDENNETKTQGPAVAWGIDLLTPGSPEAERMKIPSSIIRGRIPEKPGEILLSEDFAKRLEVEPGQIVTFFGSTMLGGMAMQNFILAGTVRFGTQAVDRGALSWTWKMPVWYSICPMQLARFWDFSLQDFMRTTGPRLWSMHSLSVTMIRRISSNRRWSPCATRTTWARLLITWMW